MCQNSEAKKKECRSRRVIPQNSTSEISANSKLKQNETVNKK